MYTIFADGEAIHSPGLDRPTRLVFNAKITQQVNMADRLEFTIYPNNPGAAAIHKLTSVIEVYRDDEILFRGRPIQSKDGWNNQRTYICEGGFAFFNDTILRPYEFTGSVRDYLQMLVTQHNSQVPAGKQFTLRTVTVTDPNNNIVRSNTDYVTTIEEMQAKLVENLGGYMVPEYTGGKWYLDYLATSSQATAQPITLAKNLLDMVREQKAENIATALIPLGAVDENTGERITIKSVNNGLDYIVDQNAADQYGLIFATETWDDVTIPANLLTKAQARLTDYATLIPTLQLTAVDLSITDQSIDPIRLLDNVTVQDDKHAASGVYLVTERSYDLSDAAKDRVTFGGALPTITGTTKKTAAEVQEIPSAVLLNASERAKAILENSTDGAIQILFNQDGVAYELRINNSQNPATATAWWRYNIGGWAFTADGGQTYTTAATNDGTIFATLIKAGILSSDNGKFYVNLDTGAATLSDVVLNGGSISLGNGTFSVSSAGAVNASNMTITGGSVTITGSNTTDGRVSVKYEFTDSGNNKYTYQSILKPAMLVNSYDLQASGGGTTHAEADLRYDRLTFVDGSTEQSSYEDTGAYVKNGANELQVLPTGITGKNGGTTKFSFSNILLSLLNNTIKLNSDGLAFYADPNFPNDPTAIYPPDGLINYTEDVNPPTGVTERFTMRFVTSKYGAYIDYFQISFIRLKFSSGQTSQGGGYITSSYGSAGNWDQAFTHLTGAFAFCLNLAGTAFHYGTQANKTQGGEYKVFSPTLISSGAIDWDIVVVGFGQYSNYA